MQEGVGKGKLDISADTLMSGQFHGEPALHSSALHEDDFLVQG